MVATSVGMMANGIFMGETNSMFSTMEGETVMSKGIAHEDQTDLQDNFTGKIWEWK